MSYQTNRELDRKVIALGNDAKVLDVGGWYACYPLATHVVDIMPYYTRGQGYFPGPRPGERFTKETWVEADITAPDFRLPYSDKYFAFAICMHTLEDLHEVRPLIRELSRVAVAGYLETPARFMEQTVGIMDRACAQVGFYLSQVDNRRRRKLPHASRQSGINSPAKKVLRYPIVVL